MDFHHILVMPVFRIYKIMHDRYSKLPDHIIRQIHNVVRADDQPLLFLLAQNTESVHLTDFIRIDHIFNALFRQITEQHCLKKDSVDRFCKIVGKSHFTILFFRT